MRLLVVGAIFIAGLVPLVSAPSTTVAPTATSTPAVADAAPLLERAPLVSSRRFACSTSQSAINPCTQATSAFTNRSGSTQYTIQNKIIEPVDYIITPTCSGQVNTCVGPGTVTVPPKSTKSFVVTWKTSSTAGSGTLSVSADDGLTPVVSTNTFTVTVPPPTLLYVAQVSPHLQRHLVDSGQVDTARFVVRNAGADSTRWSWTAICSGAALVGGTCNTPLSGKVGLAAGQQTTIGVTYTTTGAKNAAASVQLKLADTILATRRDSGTIELLVTRNDSLVQVSQQNPGETVAPDQCVTVSVARGLAVECGAVRAIHTLPSLRSMSKVRAPVLLYNSQHAHPRPAIRADVTLPDTRIPDSVTAVLKDSSGTAIGGATGTWAGSQWRARSTRRIAVSYDASAWPTTVHRYTLDVRRWYGATPELVSVTGSHWVVNRVESPYGAGWWVAGLEYIANPDGSLYLTTGDGATRRYLWVAPGTYVAPWLDRPDSIVLVGGTYYERRLPHGVKVRYLLATGLQSATVNRLGHVTRFVWVPGTLRVDSIIPPSGSSVVAWKFQYDGSAHLQSVTRTGTGVTGTTDQLTMNGNGELTQILQRDGTTIQFSYGAELHRLQTRTDERGVTDSVGYDAGSRVARVTVQSSLSSASVRDTLKLTAAETRGLAGTPAVSLDRASTVIDGFRTDVADTAAYLINKWGAPTRVRNALGDESQLARTNGTFSALVTYLRAPNGRALVATYDARGNIASLLDSATVKAGPVYALTQYTWDPKWDFVTRIVNPELDSAKSAYDSTNGNLLWQEDGRGSATRTTFAYDGTTGLLRRARTATGVTDTLLYETALNNAYQRNNPLAQYELWTQDGTGRVFRTERPTVTGGPAVVDSVTLDVMDRPTLTVTRTANDTLWLRQQYSASGQLTRIAKASAQDNVRAKVDTIVTTFGYDGRNRMVAETTFKRSFLAPPNPRFLPLNIITSTYDPAGNLTAGGRNPFTVTYDALNRRVRTVASDTNSFVYDEVGNLRHAGNAVGRVARTYGQNSTLLTDTLRIATRRLSERAFSSNIFGIKARYDLNQRRIAFVTDSQRVWFNRASGLMDSIGDLAGNRFTFSYDNDARTTQVTRLSQSAFPMVETIKYDTVGRVEKRVQRTWTGGVLKDTLHKDSLAYDLRDRIIRNQWTNDIAAYNPMGPIDTVGYGQGGYERYQTDALGLRYYGNGNAALNGTATYAYVGGTERLANMVVAPNGGVSVSPDTTTYSIQPAGMITKTVRWKSFLYTCPGCPAPSILKETRTDSNEFDLSWRLVSSKFTLDTSPAPPQYRAYSRTERYRYDPLGRRVWKEMIRDTLQNLCPLHDKSSGCRNEVTRTIWDGANILYDVRIRADTLGDASEGSPPTGAFTGTVAYLHAGGIDVPLSINKDGTVVIPYADWRGTYDVGTCGTPAATRCTDLDAYFPLQNATSFGDGSVPPNGPPNWFGEIIGGQFDGSGYGYKRNRYYDARSGRFTQEDPTGLAGGTSAYGFAAGDPLNFVDPFGLCAEPAADSVRVTVTVNCPDGTLGTRDVWARSASSAEVAAVLGAAAALAGGNATFTPSGVQNDYGVIANSGALYVLPTTSADGLPLAVGGVTSTGGSQTFVAFSTAVMGAMVAGNYGAKIGNTNVINVVGHEGVHLMQGEGYGNGGVSGASTRTRENEAYSVSWRVRKP